MSEKIWTLLLLFLPPIILRYGFKFYCLMQESKKSTSTNRHSEKTRRKKKLANDWKEDSPITPYMDLVKQESSMR